MALTIGSQLGSHEIIALLGKGGMGEVYRARDLKLKREVAIKILPAEFARDADRVSRFQREAEVLASLNHPNIAAIHDLEEANGTRYLVLELVEGETLADRIARVPISVDEALTIAIQICEALAAAHERGIIHRDLKPANIKVSPQGKVKVLDFGLAKISESFAASDLSNSPTRITAATSDTILGTAGYMSPQQARGQSVDKRTDIWSFGCVMYEMLTGRQAFEGETASDVVARILEREPDWSKLPIMTPPAARRLLRRCLIKNANGRLQDIGDAHIELNEAGMPDRNVTHAVARVTARERIAWALTMVFGVSLAVLFLFWQHPAPSNQMPSQPPVHVDLDLGPNAPQRGLGANVVLSTDGRRLVFATVGTDGMTHLFVRRLDEPKSTQLTDTDGASAPFFAPDGQWVGFFAQGKVKKVSVDGGTVTVLCDAPNPRGASWGDDGNIVFAPDVQTPLFRVSASGGDTPVPLTTFSPGEVSHRWPQVLPGAKVVLFTALTAANFAAFDQANIEAMVLPGGSRKTLHKGGSYGRYLVNGDLLYARNATVFSVPLDIKQLETRGTPVPVLEQVAYVPTGGAAQFDVSLTGELAYETGSIDTATIQWVDGAGKVEPLLDKPGNYTWPRLSPDGNRLVYRLSEGLKTDLWSYDWRRGTNTRLTTDTAIHNSPAWSLDGRHIAYQGEGGVFWIAAEGGTPRLLIQADNTPYPESFSPDGRWLAMSVPNPKRGDLDIWIAPLTGEGDMLQAGKPEVFADTKGNERNATFSPDGHWLAYESSESGRYEIYVRAFSGTPAGETAKWQISSGGGSNPRWSKSGRELFYGANDRVIGSD